jgi:ribosome biogenesis GTPase
MLIDEPGGELGLVVRVDATQCLVKLNREVKPMQLSREIRPVVGDEVQVDLVKNRITKVLPRRSQLARPSDRDPSLEKAVVANIDLVAVIVSVGNPPLHPRLIDRYLFAIHKGGSQPLIVVNKLDLLSEMDAVKQLDQLEPYRAMGVPCVYVSAQLGRGLDALNMHIRGKRVVFVGHSGVGKSSLLNAVLKDVALAPVARASRPCVSGPSRSCGDEVHRRDADNTHGRDVQAPATAAEGEVSAKSGKGRHTTTASQLYALDDGTEIVDTPGIRSFAVDIENDLETGFPDIQRFAVNCQFTDCQHLQEDGCAVKDAVRDGLLPRARYETYRRMMDGEVATGMGFVCVHCGATAATSGAGTSHRNHCPRCLHSVHLDKKPGDRLAMCGGTMEPVSVWVRKRGEWALIHRCRECGAMSSNRIAADDNEMLLLSIAAKPMSKPPFSLEHLEAGA